MELITALVGIGFIGIGLLLFGMIVCIAIIVVLISLAIPNATPKDLIIPIVTGLIVTLVFVFYR